LDKDLMVTDAYEIHYNEMLADWYWRVPQQVWHP